NAPPSPALYPLSLHDALPISDLEAWAEHRALEAGGRVGVADETIREHERRAVDRSRLRNAIAELAGAPQILHGGLGRPGQLRYRSEEHTSELQSRRDLVCRLL